MFRQGTGTQLVYSPSDLIRFLESPFASWMDRYYLEYPDGVSPDEQSEAEKLVTESGNKHEARYLERLKEDGWDVGEIQGKGKEALKQTQAAIQEGREVIFQAYLQGGSFAGHADFLFRVSEPGEPPRYEIWDTKLALKAKPYYLIQLCCYSELLTAFQGQFPHRMGVILGDQSAQSWPVSEFFYYYQRLKADFLDLIETFDPNTPPVPEARADHGRWTSHAEAKLKEMDHLVQVAGISTGQIQKLQENAIQTLEELAKANFLPRIPKLDPEVLNRLHHQARLQKETRDRRAKKGDATPPIYEVLQPDPQHPRRGLALLPPASPNDIFFDMEGFPLAEGGLEYLFGASYRENGQLEFKAWWAHNREEEKRAFEGVIDWAYARWQEDPSLHIYHYAAYEVSAVRKLMGNHGTREEKVDELLRNHVFVDLYQVVHQGLQIGEPSYSIKYVEHLYRGKREGDVGTAVDSIVHYARWLESGEPTDPKKSKILSDIQDYNQDDCDSTAELADWLRSLQQEARIEYCPPPQHTENKEPQADQEKQAWLDERQQLQEKLESLAESERETEDGRIDRLLADLFDFHRREDKPVWWRLFDRLGQTHDELKEDIACIGDAELESPEGRPEKQSLVFTYQFGPQDTKIRSGQRVHPLQNSRVSLEIVSLDDEEGKLEVKVSRKKLNDELEGDAPNRTSFIPNEHIKKRELVTRLHELAKDWGNSRTLPPPLRALFLQQPPVAPKNGSLLRKNEDPQDGAVRIAKEMKGATLCIQGPPGTGKTTTASRMIAELLKAGKRVGISSNSHHAIINLLAACNEEMDGKLTGIKVGGDSEDPTLAKCTEIQHIQSSGQAKAAYTGGVVAGTAWLFSREDWGQELDYLFIDEAGQVPLANIAAMSHATRNLVLLGDQMQLEQPSEGSHPGEAGKSALIYYLGDHSTIPPDLGIFLPQTNRLRPELCEVISELVYEGRLHASEKAAQRHIHLSKTDRNLPYYAGLYFSPVEHDGNVQGSPEEVDQIRDLTDRLLESELESPEEGKRPLGIDDILYVAPYNMQVHRLRQALPEGARVVSVDKFQGQEASVVILSLCSSFGEYGSRGLEFILDRNRLNVALSRARILAIVVGDPRIAGERTNSIPQMRRLNFFCRLLNSRRNSAN